MSRIGKAPIEIPAGVTVTVDKDNVVTVKGHKGTLTQKVNPDLEVKVEDGHVVVTRPSDDREHRAQHGLFRALIHNMVVGVSTGYRKEMELVGVGYRAASNGQVLELSLGFSHAIYIKLPPEIKVEAKCAPRFVHSASPSLTRAKVSSLWAKLSVASLVSQQAQNNFNVY